MQGDPGPGDRGGPCAAIGLQHIAVEGDLTFSQRLKIGDGSQTAADQTLDLMRAAGLLAGADLALRARVGCPREHAVFGGDPAASLTAQPGGRLVFERSRAQHMRGAEFDQAGAFGKARDIAF